MSEYQYYEFQAIDRPLSDADRRELRNISSRARITAVRFVNSYEWGDFKGDPTKLMERWFDLHLYLANWGSRRLMIRLPKRLMSRSLLGSFTKGVKSVALRAAGDNLIVDIGRDELEFDDWDDGSAWLAALAPLRAELLSGDLRLFYLVWLTAVEEDCFEPDRLEPLPGIAPMSTTLEAFAEFFGIDPDLVAAAAERPAGPMVNEVPADAVRKIISAMREPDKVKVLSRLFDGDPQVGAELRAEITRGMVASGAAGRSAAFRTVGELRARAAAIRSAREHKDAEKRAAEDKKREREAAKAHHAHLLAISRRGETVWTEVEAEIERRNAGGYDRAKGLLLDLQEVARERGADKEFDRRLRAIRERHARKERFIERLTVFG